jgi:hypothetical protein
VADVPLLDEAAELLGVDDSAAKAARRELERAQRLEAKYAQEVLDVTGIADLGMVDAETLAAWNRDNGPALSTAERAAADRSWAYGHVIIDEAQELSAMAWRMVLRRNPSRSMTVVGDVAQTGSPAGARSWKEMLTPLVGTRWREERLTVNYRTPTEIMTVAADVLASVAPDERPPDSVRSEGVPPHAIQVPARADIAAIGSRPADGTRPDHESRPDGATRPDHESRPGVESRPDGTDLPGNQSGPDGATRPGATRPGGVDHPADETLAATVALVARTDLAELGGPDGGRLAVIAPDARLAEIAAALPEAIPGDRPESLDAAATLLTVSQAKGLEFDRVVLADPSGVIAQSANGGHDLYVAITRATHRLTVVHEGPLPPSLHSLTAVG